MFLSQLNHALILTGDWNEPPDVLIQRSGSHSSALGIFSTARNHRPISRPAISDRDITTGEPLLQIFFPSSQQQSSGTAGDQTTRIALVRLTNAQLRITASEKKQKQSCWIMESASVRASDAD